MIEVTTLGDDKRHFIGEKNRQEIIVVGEFVTAADMNTYMTDALLERYSEPARGMAVNEDEMDLWRCEYCAVTNDLSQNHLSCHKCGAPRP